MLLLSDSGKPQGNVHLLLQGFGLKKVADCYPRRVFHAAARGAVPLDCRRRAAPVSLTIGSVEERAGTRRVVEGRSACFRAIEAGRFMGEMAEALQRCPALTGLPSRKSISINFSLVGIRATCRRKNYVQPKN